MRPGIDFLPASSATVLVCAVLRRQAATEAVHSVRYQIHTFSIQTNALINRHGIHHFNASMNKPSSVTSSQLRQPKPPRTSYDDSDLRRGSSDLVSHATSLQFGYASFDSSTVKLMS